ncbi:MAG: PepSY domain-containing protein [Candidatus Bipolaricaulota bacterium]|nr:PepSY domain-containing protein [Candidatus Bipolaricaulota bacterium]MCS7273847.1 PepSY domain-containing protein [Candidatus Bipolaricaulota bacterium]MDW8110735.1 PepSY domain-containing protein [Candidatus Bipolaricaulota bacterium]MDW8328407.1 PepSY domain-containing protein [Candidatus Bipolaricaulota bacterium]
MNVRKLSRTIGLLVLAFVLLAGVAYYYASAQDPNAPASDQPRPPEIVGSVKAPSRIATLVSMAKIDLSKAIEAATARQSGTVFAAHLGERNGYVVYQVAILTADGNSVLVTVDAGDGKVLSVVQLPMGGRFGHFGPMGPGKRGGR